jgi:hypothetical protein
MYRSMCRSMYRSIYRSMYWSMYRSIYRSMYRSIYRSMYRSIYRSMYRSIYRSMYLHKYLLKWALFSIRKFYSIVSTWLFSINCFLDSCVPLAWSLLISWNFKQRPILIIVLSLHVSQKIAKQQQGGVS